MFDSRSTLSKQERLCGVKRIDSLFKDGSSFVCYPFRILYMEATASGVSEVCFLVSVSKRKLKRAVDRNRVKRLVREACRINKHFLYSALPEGTSLYVGFVWIPSEILGFDYVNQKMGASMARLLDSLARKKASTDENEHLEGIV